MAEIKIDFNNNGVQDYKESWFWRAVAKAFCMGLLALPRHTQGYKAGLWLKAQMDANEVLPQVRQ